jgi:hypothetical protein
MHTHTHTHIHTHTHTIHTYTLVSCSTRVQVVILDGGPILAITSNRITLAAHRHHQHGHKDNGTKHFDVVSKNTHPSLSHIRCYEFFVCRRAPCAALQSCLPVCCGCSSRSPTVATPHGPHEEPTLHRPQLSFSSQSCLQTKKEVTWKSCQSYQPKTRTVSHVKTPRSVRVVVCAEKKKHPEWVLTGAQRGAIPCLLVVCMCELCVYVHMPYDACVSFYFSCTAVIRRLDPR